MNPIMISNLCWSKLVADFERRGKKRLDRVVFSSFCLCFWTVKENAFIKCSDLLKKKTVAIRMMMNDHFLS